MSKHIENFIHWIWTQYPQIHIPELRTKLTVLASNIYCDLMTERKQYKDSSEHWQFKWQEADKKCNELQQQVYLPGTWTCDKCHFEQNNRILNPNTGEVGVPLVEEVMTCPNDGEVMRRVTYQEASESNYKAAISHAEACNHARRHCEFWHDLFLDCPHAKVAFAEDGDTEDELGMIPKGWNLRVSGCRSLLLNAPTLGELVEMAIAHNEMQDDGMKAVLQVFNAQHDSLPERQAEGSCQPFEARSVIHERGRPDVITDITPTFQCQCNQCQKWFISKREDRTLCDDCVPF